MIYIAGIAAVVFALMGAANWYLSKRVDGLKEAVKTEQARVARFAAAERDTQAKVAEQEAALAALRADADARAEASRKALADALARGAVLSERERELLARARTGDPCADVSSLLRSPPPR